MIILIIKACHDWHRKQKCHNRGRGKIFILFVIWAFIWIIYLISTMLSQSEDYCTFAFMLKISQKSCVLQIGNMVPSLDGLIARVILGVQRPLIWTSFLVLLFLRIIWEHNLFVTMSVHNKNIAFIINCEWRKKNTSKHPTPIWYMVVVNQCIHIERIFFIYWKKDLL